MPTNPSLSKRGRRDQEKQKRQFEEETEFIKRMLSIQEDKIFDEELLQKFENLELRINRNSSTLALECINKLYEVLNHYVYFVHD